MGAFRAMDRFFGTGLELEQRLAFDALARDNRRAALKIVSLECELAEEKMRRRNPGSGRPE